MNMKTKLYIAVVGVVAALALIAVAVWLVRRRKRTPQSAHFMEKWQAVQKLCASKDTWPKAIIDADILLGAALKKKHFKGKTTGERLTKAQHQIGDNEGVWFGHKLRGKLDTNPDMQLKEADVKQALVGIRQALRDIGVLQDGK